MLRYSTVRIKVRSYDSLVSEQWGPNLPKEERNSSLEEYKTPKKKQPKENNQGWTLNPYWECAGLKSIFIYQV